MSPDAGAADEVVDLVFAVRGEAVAADHAWALRQALATRLPWLADEAALGIHAIAGGSAVEGVVYLNRRAKLALRLPRHRVAAAQALAGLSADLGGAVTIAGAGVVRSLEPYPVLYAHFVHVGTADEGAFLGECLRRVEGWLDRPQMICGKARSAATDRGTLHGYSLMLHGLGKEASLRLQRVGLGEERTLGCGLFVPHKSVVAVGE